MVTSGVLFNCYNSEILRLQKDPARGLEGKKVTSYVGACSLVVSDVQSETKGFQFESDCYLCAEVSYLQ